MKKYKSASEGYGVSSQIKKILFKEGYVALRIIPENSEKINLCETTKSRKTLTSSRSRYGNKTGNAYRLWFFSIIRGRFCFIK